jgi:hypothetical protein
VTVEGIPQILYEQVNFRSARLSFRRWLTQDGVRIKYDIPDGHELQNAEEEFVIGDS